MESRLYRCLYRHGWLAFLLMGLSFMLFGLASLNLVQVFGAAWEFWLAHGLDAVRDGVLWQLGGLLLSAYAAVAFFVVFKLCEKVLVERLAGKPKE